MKQRNSRWGSRSDAKTFGPGHPQVKRQEIEVVRRRPAKSKYPCKKGKGDHDFTITDVDLWPWHVGDGKTISVKSFHVSIQAKCIVCGKKPYVWGLLPENVGVDSEQLLKDINDNV